MSGSISGDRIVAGAAWMVLFKLADRLLALVSMLVLARLLVPADFGLIALATSLAAMLEVLGGFGLDTALIQRPDASRGHYDTVWTFNLLFGLVLAVLLSAFAWPAAAFYDEPRLATVLLVLAATKAIGGFESPGVIAFRKDLEFKREFRFQLAKRLLTTFVVTIPLAIALRNYWALLGGTLLGTTISVALSYKMQPYRPTLSLASLGEMMHFSGWLFLTGIVEFLALRTGDLIVARWAGPAALGMLTLARTIARLPTREIVAPIHRALYPGYVKLAGDRDRLRAAYLKVTAVLLLSIMPAGIGLAFLAEPAVLILLGRQWLDAVPLVQILAINGVVGSMMVAAHHVNLAVGLARSTSLALVAYATIAIPLMLFLVPDYGAIGAAAAALAAAILTAPLELLLLTKAIDFRARDLLAILHRPGLGIVVMIGVLLVIRGQIALPAAFIEQVVYLVTLAGIGAVAFGTTVYLLWRRAGKSESAEAWVLEQSAKRLSILGQRFRPTSRSV